MFSSAHQQYQYRLGVARARHGQERCPEKGLQLQHMLPVMCKRESVHLTLNSLARIKRLTISRVGDDMERGELISTVVSACNLLGEQFGNI